MSKFQLLATSSIIIVQIGTFIFIFSILLSLFVLLGIFDSYSNRDKVFFLSSVFSNMLFGSTLMMILSCACHQLEALNTLLGNFLQDEEILLKMRLLKKVPIIYDKLCDIFDNISKFYLLSMVGFLFGFTYFNIFFIYEVCLLFQVQSKELFYFLGSSVLWNLYYGPFVLFITISASLIEKEGIKTVDIVQKLIRAFGNSKDSKRLIILHQQSLHRRPKVSCELFELNWSFFFTILAGIFSFSIILIQFYDVNGN